jgi:hypothetical protein
MNHVLICVEKPKNNESLGDWNKWLPFLDALHKQPELTAGTKNPVENVWLIPLDSGLKQVTGFLALFRDYQLKYTVHLLDNEPKVWK